MMDLLRAIGNLLTRKQMMRAGIVITGIVLLGMLLGSF